VLAGDVAELVTEHAQHRVVTVGKLHEAVQDDDGTAR